MLDVASGEAMCVVDLDTVMPGCALYDFGDMVRTTTSPTLEDELDLSKVKMQMPMFKKLAEGYYSTAGKFLTKDEKALDRLFGQTDHLRDRHPLSDRLPSWRYLFPHPSARSQPRPLPHAIQTGRIDRAAGRRRCRNSRTALKQPTHQRRSALKNKSRSNHDRR